VKKIFGWSGLRPEPHWGARQHSPYLLAGGAYCLTPRIPPRSRLFASIFGPPGLIGQHLPKVFIPPMRKGRLIKTLVMPIFGAKQCIRMQEFVLKIYQKNSGPPRREGIHLFASTPCPPAECWCPSASSRLVTALLRMISREYFAIISAPPPCVCSATLVLITCCQTVAM